MVIHNNRIYGLGVTEKNAGLALLFAQDGAQVMKLSHAFGGIDYMTDGAREFIENWEVESYRQKLPVKPYFAEYPAFSFLRPSSRPFKEPISSFFTRMISGPIPSLPMGPHIQAPHLDSLAEEGFSFLRNYCASSISGAVCVASWAILMTGQNSMTLPVKSLRPTGAEPDMPAFLEKPGNYQSIIIGK